MPTGDFWVRYARQFFGLQFEFTRDRWASHGVLDYVLSLWSSHRERQQSQHKKSRMDIPTHIRILPAYTKEILHGVYGWKESYSDKTGSSMYRIGSVISEFYLETA
uniref:Uncharacterized protein n=1 Tax=Oryza sativa subsp. japonica TaxID=39947 RepID=Q67VJ8_ORYSJ|nr:hypothetical protein [Oryza sativa Japonica Group]BAD37821.1 hypothetical protein [Oryza sativa Japonica Group]